MTVGIVLGFGLFVLCVWLVSQPLLSNVVPLSRDLMNDSDAFINSQSNSEELELDYKVGKISESDYRAIQESNE